MNKLTAVLGAAILVAAAGAGVHAQEPVDDETCTMCHDDIGEVFASTPHGQKRNDAPRCESCHGSGAAHVDEGDAALIKIPQGAAGARVCASCHSGLHSSFEAGEVHGRAGVTCESCHRMHQPATSHGTLLVDDHQALCASCHPRQERTFSRPYGHRLGRAGLDCVTCHNPHGGPGERSVRVDRSGDTVCLTCHADLRGPYVFPHVVGVTDGCESCHQPHGSSNPYALKRSRVDQLCLECHSPLTGTTIGSQPPSIHDLRSQRYRECTVCHVAIHGSNTSPALLK